MVTVWYPVVTIFRVCMVMVFRALFRVPLIPHLEALKGALKGYGVLGVSKGAPFRGPKGGQNGCIW